MSLILGIIVGFAGMQYLLHRRQLKRDQEYMDVMMKAYQRSMAIGNTKHAGYIARQMKK